MTLRHPGYAYPGARDWRPERSRSADPVEAAEGFAGDVPGPLGLGAAVADLLVEAPGLLDVALRHAEKAGAQRIARLNLVIGELASIVDESVQFCWDLVSRGTLAEGAELRFERVPGQLRCTDCGHSYALAARDYTCPACGERRVVAVGGDEFRLESIEVE